MATQTTSHRVEQTPSGPSILEYRSRLLHPADRRPPAPFKDPNRPSFTVVTIVLNAEKTLKQTIESVIGQNYPNVEYIIIDGVSRDKSLEIVRSFGDKITYSISEPDRGIYDAFNKGVALARGDWIGILNADDWYEPGIFERIEKTLKNWESLNSRSGARNDSSSPSIPSNSPQILFGQTRFWEDEKPSYLFHSAPEKLPLDTTVGHQAIFVRRELHEKMGLYRIDLRLASDYEFFLRAHLAKVPYLMLEYPVANMRSEGASDQQWKRLYREVAQVQALLLGRPLWAQYRRGVKVLRTTVSRRLSAIGLEPVVALYRKFFSVLKKEQL